MRLISKNTVCLARCRSYDTDELWPLLQSQMDLLGVPTDLSTKRIFLKPNLISAGAPGLACSSPLFVKAVASCFLSRGAKVFLGDSPAFGTAAHVLKRHGFTDALSGMAVEIVPFRTRVLKTLSCGITIGVAAEPLDCDYFVNLPRVKAHVQMGVTLAVKNVFGIVLGARKAWLHMKHGDSPFDFSRIILDLQELLPPSFVFADGIEVMNRQGPTKGSSLALGCLAASKNAIALDRAMLEVLEVNTKRIPLALAAQELQLEGAYLRSIEFPQLLPEDFSGSRFQIPTSLIPIRFQLVRFFRSFLKRILSH